MKFDITATKIEGVKILKRQEMGDQRGSFSRLFSAAQFQQLGWDAPVAQTNLSQNNGQGSFAVCTCNCHPKRK